MRPWRTSTIPTTKDPLLALFPTADPEPAPRRGRGWLGWALLLVAFFGVAIVAWIPAPYVIEQPGPVFDTLGDVTIDGELMPMIMIPTQETYPTDGSLRMLTVSVRGNPDELPNWFEIAAAYLNPSRAVVPVETIYPPGSTVDDSSEQGAIDMANSQKEAVAAALTHLGYEFASTLSVADVLSDGPSAGILEPGDIILEVNGETFPDVTGLRAAIAENGVSAPADVLVVREGVETTLRINPELSDAPEPTPVFGILVSSAYDFPFEVTIQLQNVGGPSAGMMFALGIIDKLTPESLTGGQFVAGTGTISATGEVGAIGGIRQKMWGALDSGADYFLAPAANCDEVTGFVPDGLTVFAVETLDDALAALEAISTGADASDLPTCPAP